MIHPIFKRKIYDEMLVWKERQAGRTALLIKGARRVGKSTIALEFARHQYRSHAVIDFSAAGAEIKNLFDDVSDLDFFFMRLQSLLGVRLHRRQSVIILDEIQLCPRARQAVKHLVADGRYDYIETGSLLSIRANTRDILIPSEETRIEMHPMDFEEFLWALGQAPVFELIRYSYAHLRPMGEAVNRANMRYYRLYMLVGGMPQAVEAYLGSDDFSDVDAVKRNILELYIDDLLKIDASGRVSALFKGVPTELSRGSGSYKVSHVLRGSRPSRAQTQLAELADSLTVNIAYTATDPSVGFSLHTDRERFKIYLADTGLFVTLAFMDGKYTDNIIYRKLLGDRLNVNLGYVYENAVAQALRGRGDNLFYYMFRGLDELGVEHRYEIDFLLSRDGKICPVEVKSSNYRTHSSLDHFQAKFSARISHPYLLYTKDLRHDGTITCLPVYMAGLL